MTTLSRNDALDKVFDLHYQDGDGVVEFDHALLYEWRPGDDIPRIIDENDEIYGALSSLAIAVRDGKEPPTGIVLATSGWAAPIGREAIERGDTLTGKPSEHPERMRCSLWIAATVDGQTTRCAIAKPDGTVEIVRDEDEDSPEGHGPLAEAVDMVGVTLWGLPYAARLFSLAVLADPDSVLARELNNRAELAVRGAAMIENLTDEGGE